MTAYLDASVVLRKLQREAGSLKESLKMKKNAIYPR